MKTRIVKPFFSAYGVKKRCRKPDSHVHSLNSIPEEDFHKVKDKLTEAFRHWINSEFKSVAKATFSYWPGHEEDGMEQLLPFSSVTVEKISATQ